MPLVIGETPVVPPRRRGDCTCAFCGLYRAHHYWRRAVAATAVVPLLLWLTDWVARYLTDQHAAGGTQVVGALLLVSTAAAVLAAATWYQPLRRLVHILRPRTRQWPPPTP